MLLRPLEPANTEVPKSHGIRSGLTHLLRYENILVRCKSWLPGARRVLWLRLNRARTTSAYYHQPNSVAGDSDYHAVVRDWIRLLLDPTLAKHAAAPFLEQELHQLVGGSSSVIVHDNLHHGDDGSWGRTKEAGDRVGGLLDVRSLLQRGDWIRRRASRGLADLSPTHRRGVVSRLLASPQFSYA
jgi:hypothetical protein